MVSLKTTTLPLLPILQRTFPDISSYQVDDHIVQSNAEGFCLTTFTNKSGDDNLENNEHKYLFVKCVEASKYSDRPWADLRRALLYSRTEARFYSEILPLLKEKSTSNWEIAPICYLSESTLDDLIGEEESTAANTQEDGKNDEPKYDSEEYSILKGKGGYLVLQSLKESYYQTSPLSLSQASECLSAAAKLHASAFENKEILEQVSQRLCKYGGSYHLTNRNPRELREIKKTWDDLVSNIKDAAPPNFFEKEGIRNLGERIYNVAEYVSQELSPSYNDDFATIVHGDYKAMNVFLPSINDGEPLLIDFSSVGIGLGVSDIAMHIPHAVHPKDLEDGGEDQLVEHYYRVFCEALPSSKKGSYTVENFKRHYHFATVDYFRFILGRMWKGLTMEVFEKRRTLKNFAEFNRTVEAAVAFIVRVDKYLGDIEKEMESKINQENN